jgi:hypothetical protein
MILKKEIDTLTRSELLKLNRGLKQACSILLGDSKPEIRTINKVNDINLAHYDPYLNRITIYRPMVKNIDSYVKVFIHEWTHSLQKGIKKNYTKLEKKYGYWYNPYEVEARESEKEYKSVIWRLTKMTF